MWFLYGALNSLSVWESELPDLYCISLQCWWSWSARVLVSWLRKWSVQCLYDFHHNAQEDDVRTTKPFFLSTFRHIFDNFLMSSASQSFSFLPAYHPASSCIYCSDLIILYLLKKYNNGCYCVENVAKPQLLHYLLPSSLLDAEFRCLKVLPWLKPWGKTAATFAGCCS